MTSYVLIDRAIAEAALAMMRDAQIVDLLDRDGIAKLEAFANALNRQDLNLSCKSVQKRLMTQWASNIVQQREWQGLTEADRLDIRTLWNCKPDNRLDDLMKMTEAVLKEKNHD